MVYYKTMESLNKVLTVVLGLIVVVVLLAVITSRLKIGQSGIFSFKPVAKITPVPTGREGLISPTKAPRRGFFSFLNNPKPTKNPTSQLSPAPTKTNEKIVFFNKDTTPTSSPGSARPQASSQVVGVKSIPKTGPELFFPLAASSFVLGMYLKRKTK